MKFKRGLALDHIAVRALLACLSLVVFCAVLLPGATPSFGKSAQEQRIDQIRKERDKIHSKIKELNAQEKTLSDEVIRIDARAGERKADIEFIETELEKTQLSLSELESRRTELIDQAEASSDLLAERAVAIYVLGEFSYIDLLFQVASFGEFIDRMFFIQAVLEHDQVIIEDISIQRQSLNEQQTLVASRVAEIEAIHQELSVQMDELEMMIQEKKLTMDAIEDDKTLFLQKIKEMEAESRRIAEEIRNIANTASGYDGAFTGDFMQPVSTSYSVNSGYGYRIHPIYKTKKMHTGLDFGAPKGTKIMAASKGRVVFTGTRRGYGKTVMVDHGTDPKTGKRITTLYAHMNKITCDAGDSVEQGDKIGEVGCTGMATGNHLHYELRFDGEHVNPSKAGDLKL